MAEPFEVLNDEVSAILLLVVALLRDHVSQHVFGHHATDNDTFDHFASSSRFSKLLLAKLICSELQFVAPTHALGSDEIVVHPHYGD